MSVEWIVTGMILLSAMVAGGISLYIKRRKEAQADLFEATDIKPDFAEPEKEDEIFKNTLNKIRRILEIEEITEV